MTPEKFAHYKVDHPKFDDDHYTILMQIKRMMHENFSSREEVKLEAAKLIDMIIRHFIEEEQYMLEVKYNHFESHREQHVELSQYLKRICTNISDLSRTVSKFQFDKVSHAFVHHIDNFDIQFYNAAKVKESLNKS
jgi:hemerythrin-like metal-binding protein